MAEQQEVPTPETPKEPLKNVLIKYSQKHLNAALSLPARFHKFSKEGAEEYRNLADNAKFPANALFLTGSSIVDGLSRLSDPASRLSTKLRERLTTEE